MSRQTMFKLVLLAGLLLLIAAMVGNYVREHPAQKPAALPARAMPVSTVYTDRECLARNLAFETLGNSHSRSGVGALLARQEMEAIAHVVFHRKELGKHRGYRNTVCDVVYQEGAFSWTYKLPPDEVPKASGRWQFMLAVADDLLAGKFEHPWPEANWCVENYKRTDGKGVDKNPGRWHKNNTEAVAVYGDHTFSCPKKVLSAAR